MDAPTTRSAARQQQLEEQVTTILGLMQEQGRSQAEQAQLSERRQPQLLQELQEQHQQQRAKMAQEYEGHWHSLNTAQAVGVLALEDNNSDMKWVMQSHIAETETRLWQ